MPAFTFTATASDGKSVTNTSEAVSISELRQRLSQQGYTVKEIKPVTFGVTLVSNTLYGVKEPFAYIPENTLIVSDHPKSL